MTAREPGSRYLATPQIKNSKCSSPLPLLVPQRIRRPKIITYKQYCFANVYLSRLPLQITFKFPILLFCSVGLLFSTPHQLEYQLHRSLLRYSLNVQLQCYLQSTNPLGVIYAIILGGPFGKFVKLLRLRSVPHLYDSCSSHEKQELGCSTGMRLTGQHEGKRAMTQKQTRLLLCEHLGSHMYIYIYIHTHFSRLGEHGGDVQGRWAGSSMLAFLNIQGGYPRRRWVEAGGTGGACGLSGHVSRDCSTSMSAKSFTA